MERLVFHLRGKSDDDMVVAVGHAHSGLLGLSRHRLRGVTARTWCPRSGSSLSRIENRDDAGGCELWLKVWEELKPRFTPETRSVGDAEEVFQGLQCLSNWCQDLEQELGNAAVDDPSFHDRRIRYCREFCRLLPDSEGNTVFNMRRAIGESLFLSGRKEEGEKEFQNLVTDYPKNPWGYIGWGDMYAGHYGEAVDAARAEELYTKALGLDPDDDEFVEERLADLRAGR